MAAPGEIFALYRALIAAWNRQDATGVAALFTPEGTLIGAGGLVPRGTGDIERHLHTLFQGSSMGRFVCALQDIKMLSDEAGLLTAAAAVAPHGSSEIDPSGILVQRMLARRVAADWKVVRFQTVAADFASAEELTEIADQLTSLAGELSGPESSWTVEIERE